jgi:CRISPR-associated protein Cas5h
MTSDPSRVLVFDIEAEYGHFRKFNTTTSPLTYSIPTRVALTGMLGGIMGIERESAPGIFPPGVTPTQEVFAKPHCSIGIQVRRPIQRTVIGFNLLETKKSFFEITNRIQIPFELLKYPSYRIFFQHEDKDIQAELSRRIQARQFHFTPYFGLSQFAADVSFVAEAVGREEVVEGEEFQPIHSVVNLNGITAARPIQFDYDSHFLTETMPISMDRERVVTEYGEVILEADGRSMKIKVDRFLQLGEYGNILYL